MSDALTDLREIRAAVSAVLDSFPPAALDWRPAPDAWSATDVLEHLVKSENGSLFAIRRQVAAGDDRRDLGAPDEEAFSKLRAFLRSERRTRVPEAAARFIAPTGEATYVDLRTEWEGLNDRWHEALASLPSELADVGLVRHPLAGALTAEGAARFVADHARHHLHQLRRLREAEGFPVE